MKSLGEISVRVVPRIYRARTPLPAYNTRGYTFLLLIPRSIIPPSSGRRGRRMRLASHMRAARSRQRVHRAAGARRRNVINRGVRAATFSSALMARVPQFKRYSRRHKEPPPPVAHMSSAAAAVPSTSPGRFLCRRFSHGRPDRSRRNVDIRALRRA